MADTKTKKCTVCEKVLPLDEFRRVCKCQQADGHDTICIGCREAMNTGR